MARKKSKIVNIFGLNAVPLTPTKKAEGYETRKEFFAREATETEAKATAPLRKLESELKSECADITRRVKAFYSLDLDEMKTYDRTDAPVDYIRPEGGDFTSRTGPRTGPSDAEVYFKFREDLAERGPQLTDSGWQRLGTWVGALVDSGIAATPAVWEEGLYRLQSLGCFQPGELIDFRPRPAAPAPVVPPAQPSIDGLRGEHREERQQIMKIVSGQWSVEVAQFFWLWVESLKQNFGYDFPVELAGRAGEYMVMWNLSPLRHETYDQIRRAFGKLGYMPDMRTESERLADLIEDADLSNRDVRRDIGLRTREITNPNT